MKHARGQYIGFVDSDDWVEVRAYEKIYDRARENNADILIAVGS